MYCRHCGAFIPEGCSFCEQCGTPVPKIKPAYEEDPPAPARPPEPGGKKRRTVLIAVIAAVIVCAGGICGALISGISPGYSKKLETARTYVEEENYDQAEEAYLELIADTPKKEAAYLELSDVYVTQKRYEDSVAILKKGEKATGKESVFKEPLQKSKRGFSGVWKKAYQKILRNHQVKIELYEYPEYSDPSGATALCDINGDEIPELFFMEGLYEYGGGTLYVYSYRGGKAVELDVPFPQMNLSRSSEMEDHFIDAAAGGGTVFAVYKSAQDGRFVISAFIIDEDSQTVSCEYTIDEDLTVTEEYWGDYCSLIFNDSGSEITGRDHDYYHGEETIDQGEFDKEQDRLAGDIEEFLLTSSLRTNPESPILNQTTEREISALFCADMIRKLAENKKDKGGAKAEPAAADYSAVLDEYESVFQQIMDGSYTSGDEISELGDLKYVPEGFIVGVSDPTSMEYHSDLTLQYAEKDLNGDGTMELITGCMSGDMDNPVIDSVFTMSKNGSPVRLISSDSFMYRAYLEIREGGLIEYSGSSGATAMNYDFYSLPKGGTELKKEDSFSTRSDENDYDTIIYDHNGETLSEGEYHTQLEKRQTADLMKLDWQEK